MSAIALLALAAAAQPAATLGDIRMHLFYQGTGRLSPDPTRVPGFAGWNVIIGEGDAEEPANDLLVVTELRTVGQVHLTGPLHVTVTDGKNRVLSSSSIRSILTSDKGRAYLPLWVANAGCAGKLTVTARFGKQRRSETLELHCGE